MSYVLTNGHTYITKKPSGKFTLTYDINTASQYETELKALNVTKCLPHAYRKQNYYPKEFKESTPPGMKEAPVVVNPENPKRIEPVSYPHDESDQLVQFKRNLRIIDETLGSLKTTYSTAYENLTYSGDSIEDLLHAIELQPANAVRRCYLENELKKARVLRRESKDIMHLVELVTKFELSDWGSGKLTEELDTMNNRKYTPKVREDLFV